MDFSYQVKVRSLISCALVAGHYCSYSKNRQDLDPFSCGKYWKTVPLILHSNSQATAQRSLFSQFLTSRTLTSKKDRIKQIK